MNPTDAEICARADEILAQICEIANKRQTYVLECTYIGVWPEDRVENDLLFRATALFLELADLQKLLLAMRNRTLN